MKIQLHRGYWFTENDEVKVHVETEPKECGTIADLSSQLKTNQNPPDHLPKKDSTHDGTIYFDYDPPIEKFTEPLNVYIQYIDDSNVDPEIPGQQNWGKLRKECNVD